MRPAVALVLTKYLPPALLVCVAIVQVGLARTVALTPWKGGGYGMFSTLDHSANRGVDAVIDAPDRSERLEMPASLEEAAARAAACPSSWLLGHLARGIVAREERYGRPVSRVTLRAWTTDFDRGTLAPSERTLRTFVYDVPAAP